MARIVLCVYAAACGPALSPACHPKGNYVLSHPNDNPGFQILGVGLLSANWQDIPNKENREDVAAATMGVWESPGKGTVFTAATTDWARVLAAGTQHVQRITN